MQSPIVRACHEEYEVDASTNNKSPVKNGASVAGCQFQSVAADNDEKRRTRDSTMRLL